MSDERPDIFASLARDVVQDDADDDDAAPAVTPESVVVAADVFDNLRAYTDTVGGRGASSRRINAEAAPAPTLHESQVNEATEALYTSFAKTSSELEFTDKPRRGRPPKVRSAPDPRIAEYERMMAAKRQSEPLAAAEEDDMTKRRRAQLSMANTGKSPTFQGVPLQQIQESMDKYTSIPIKVYRRNARGHLSVIGQWEKTPTELADVDMWLKDMWGGGRFRIEPRDPDNPTQYATPIPPFELEVEGPMKVANLGAGGGGGGGTYGDGPSFSAPMPIGMPPGMPGMSMPGAMMAGMGGMGGGRPDQRYLPPFVRAMEPQHQVAYAQQMGIPLVSEIPGGGGYTQPVMKFTPDALMKDEVERANTTIERERREREAERRAAEIKLEALRKESDARHQETMKRLEQLDRERNEERARDRDRMQAAEMASLRAEIQQGQNRRPAIDPAIVASLAPVLTALLTSGRESQTRAAELQAKGVSDLMQATLARSDKNPLMDMVKTLGPLLVPLAPVLKDWWDSKSPRAQADLVATMAENQLTSIGMMARLVNDFSASAGGPGAEPPWWMPMVQETMRGITSAAEKMSAGTKAAVAGPQTQLVVAPPASAQNAQPGANGGFNPLNGMSGQQIAQLIFSDPRLPQDFKTREWLRILTELHDKRPVDGVAQLVSDHIRHLDDKLPEALKGLWESDTPDQILASMFSMLPIAQMDPAYTQQFLQLVLDKLTTEEGTPSSPSQATITPNHQGNPVMEAQAQAPYAPAPQAVPFNMGAQQMPSMPFPFSQQTPQKVG